MKALILIALLLAGPIEPQPLSTPVSISASREVEYTMEANTIGVLPAGLDIPDGWTATYFWDLPEGISAIEINDGEALHITGVPNATYKLKLMAMIEFIDWEKREKKNRKEQRVILLTIGKAPPPDDPEPDEPDEPEPPPYPVMPTDHDRAAYKAFDMAGEIDPTILPQLPAVVDTAAQKMYSPTNLADVSTESIWKDLHAGLRPAAKELDEFITSYVTDKNLTRVQAASFLQSVSYGLKERIKATQ